MENAFSKIQISCGYNESLFAIANLSHKGYDMQVLRKNYEQEY